MFGLEGESRRLSEHFGVLEPKEEMGVRDIIFGSRRALGSEGKVSGEPDWVRSPEQSTTA